MRVASFLLRRVADQGPEHHKLCRVPQGGDERLVRVLLAHSEALARIGGRHRRQRRDELRGGRLASARPHGGVQSVPSARGHGRLQWNGDARSGIGEQTARSSAQGVE